jgi:hypothetical protein
MNLPYDLKVSVSKLSSCFRNTSATYKFYWLLAIIESIESGKEVIPKNELFARMIANAWYTVNYFHVSFGKQDKLQQAIEKLKEIEKLDVDTSNVKIFEKLIQSTNKETITELSHFDRNVPFKFLSPWLGTHNEKLMYQLSQENFNYPPYSLYKDCILMQPDWLDYFKRNSGVLKDFCFWNLSLFLQSKNPNVPDLPTKLKRPEKRGSLLKHKKDFWDLVINELGSVDCIYTGNKLITGTYAVEHFVPFQYVAHDLMWNLVPADPGFNSVKSDKLPSLEKYFEGFYALQNEGVQIIKKINPKNKFLEDYLSIFSTLDFSKEKYKETIEPMLMIASNNGFQFMDK